MKAKQILFPFAIEKCPPDAFALLNSLGSAPNSTVTVLSVINLNVFAVENRIYEELVAETETKLDVLAREWLPAASTRIQVRLGNTADGILAEAEASKTDLLVLPNYGASFWSRVRFVWDP